MARKGLGKGLESLIPEYYDDSFDSNTSVSLEDILKEDDETPEVEEPVNEDEIPKEEPASEESEDETTVEEESEEVVEDEDDSTGEETEPATEEITQKEGENTEETPASEDLPDDNSSEEDVQTPEEIKRQQENVAEVRQIVEKNPRITLWSSRSSAVFRYLRKTEPEFSISKEASILIEEAVSKKYPEIWKLFEDE